MRNFPVLAGFFVLVFAPLAQAASLESKGSISTDNLKKKQFAQAAKISLKEAIDVALEKQKGKAISAELENEDGFLVYDISVATADGKEIDVYVDAGNKAILGMHEDKS
jgi:uncharacterized membrane protein YkoI